MSPPLIFQYWPSVHMCSMHKTWKRLSWEEQGSFLSTTSLCVVLKTYLTKAHFLPFIDTSVTNGSGQSLFYAYGDIELVSFPTGKESRGSVIQCKLLCFFFLLIHCIINTWSHFKEIYKFLLNSEMLATFPLNITMAKYLYPKLLFSLQIITVEAVYDLLFQIHRTIQI